MNRWIRKALVVTFTVLTFGLITPPPALTMQETKSDDTRKLSQFDKQEQNIHIISDIKNDYDKDSFVKYATTQAETRSFEKFGAKIGPLIEDEFRKEILPRIESVITVISNQYPEEFIRDLIISEQPTSGIGEKIFHIYEKNSGKDIVRFHVRRDHPPQEGYWFNFHYHTYHDNFQAHHELGEIYWDKNTPPQWMS